MWTRTRHKRGPIGEAVFGTFLFLFLIFCLWFGR